MFCAFLLKLSIKNNAMKHYVSLFLLVFFSLQLIYAQCPVDGGKLTTDSGETDVTICVGSEEEDLIDVNLSGESGDDQGWIITTGQGYILSLTQRPPFSLTQFGIGVCKIYNISYEGSINGLVLANDIANLQGCYDLSNPVCVTTTDGNGGDIMTADGEIDLEFCSGADAPDSLDIELNGVDSSLVSVWIITDETGIITGFPGVPPFQFDSLGSGTFQIWNISSPDSLDNVVLGANVNDLGSCIGLSNPITVSTTGANGGMIMTTDSTTTVDLCSSDSTSALVDVILTGNTGTNSAWVITDETGIILDLPTAPPFNLDSISQSPALIWHLSFEDGLTGAEVGMDADSLQGCFGLSNPITVTKSTVDGGMVTIGPTDSTSITICVGDSIPDFVALTTDSDSLANYIFVVTTDSNQVINLVDTSAVDFDTTGFGISRIYGLSYLGNLTLQTGDDITLADLSDLCFSLSTNFIEVVRDTSLEACSTNLIGFPELSEINVFPNPVSDMVRVDVNLRKGEMVENVYIFNSFGRMVYQKKTNSFHYRFVEDLNLPNINTGMHTLTVVTNKRSISRQFFKQ